MDWIEDAERIDLAMYAVIAGTPTPALDWAMRRLSRAANYSRLSLASSALLALTGGRTGRRAATMGRASLGVTAAIVNLAVKPLGRRRRPDRLAQDVPLARHVRMPVSRGHVWPAPAVPLRAIAVLVAYSRVHTGVQYPADVVAGAVMGIALAEFTTHACDRRVPCGRAGCP